MRFDEGRSIAALCGLVLLVNGCSLSPDADSPAVAYRDAESIESLEVPPDLSRPAGSAGAEVPADGGDGPAAGQILPEFRDLDFVRAGASTWLEARGTSPEDIWPRIDGFLRAQGLQVARREPDVGIVETAWARRYDAPSRGGLSGLLSGVLGNIASSGVRDRYVIRLERMEEPQGTRIFLVHRSASEVDTNPNPQVEGDFVWTYSGGDPAVEAEMTRRLLVYLGLTQEQADQVVADTREATGGVAPRYIVDGGAARVVVDDGDYRRVFARVGDALGRIGARIQSTEIDRGVYVVKWVPPEDIERGGGGFLGLFGGDETGPVTLQLQLSPRTDGVRIKAADSEGVRRSGAVHRSLLREVAVALGAAREAVSAEEEAPRESTDGRQQDPRYR